MTKKEQANQQHQPALHKHVAKSVGETLVVKLLVELVVDQNKKQGEQPGNNGSNPPVFLRKIPASHWHGGKEQEGENDIHHQCRLQQLVGFNPFFFLQLQACLLQRIF